MWQTKASCNTLFWNNSNNNNKGICLADLQKDCVPRLFKGCGSSCSLRPFGVCWGRWMVLILPWSRRELSKHTKSIASFRRFLAYGSTPLLAVSPVFCFSTLSPPCVHKYDKRHWIIQFSTLTVETSVAWVLLQKCHLEELFFVLWETSLSSPLRALDVSSLLFFRDFAEECCVWFCGLSKWSQMAVD